jgi:hypothetical protein
MCILPLWCLLLTVFHSRFMVDRSHDFSIGKFDDRTVILCDQCEKEYHVGCLRENGFCDLKVSCVRLAPSALC